MLYDEYLGQLPSDMKSALIPQRMAPQRIKAPELKDDAVQLSLFLEAESPRIKPKSSEKKSRKVKDTIRSFRQLQLFHSDGENEIQNFNTLERIEENLSPNNIRSTLPLGEEPQVFDKDIREFYNNNTLVETDGIIGKLKRSHTDGKYFVQRIDVSDNDRRRISAYIRLRDCYHDLYSFEAKIAHRR